VLKNTGNICSWLFVASLVVHSCQHHISKSS